MRLQAVEIARCGAWGLLRGVLEVGSQPAALWCAGWGHDDSRRGIMGCREQHFLFCRVGANPVTPSQQAPGRLPDHVPGHDSGCLALGEVPVSAWPWLTLSTHASGRL